MLITDRMDYVAAASNNLGYCETVEKLMQLEVPARARYIRTVLAELQRIASHCLWLGTHAMDLGAMTVFLYAFRERELILDLFEEYCGARLTYNAMRIGGLPLDIPAGWDGKVRAFCGIMDGKLLEYEELLTENRIWRDRTRGVGVLPRSRGDRARPERAGAARIGRARATSGRTSRTPRTRTSSSTSRSAQPATPTTATWCGWRSSASRSGSSGRRSTACRRGRSWARSRA